MRSRLHATFHVRSTAQLIEARASALAIEQSVEMPLAAVEETRVLRDVVGRVEDVHQLSGQYFAVRISFSADTVGGDPGQLLNILFGNSSLHEEIVLYDLDLPADFTRGFAGPQHGITGMRQCVGAGTRALTCTALKPQGLAACQLADLAGRFARGRIRLRQG